MNAEQKRLFEETLAEDEASLQAQLEQARGQISTPLAPIATTTRASRVASLCPIICVASITTTSPVT